MESRGSGQHRERLLATLPAATLVVLASAVLAVVMARRGRPNRGPYQAGMSGLGYRPCATPSFCATGHRAECHWTPCPYFRQGVYRIPAKTTYGLEQRGLLNCAHAVASLPPRSITTFAFAVDTRGDRAGDSALRWQFGSPGDDVQADTSITLIG